MFLTIVLFFLIAYQFDIGASKPQYNNYPNNYGNNQGNYPYQNQPGYNPYITSSTSLYPTLYPQYHPTTPYASQYPVTTTYRPPPYNQNVTNSHHGSIKTNNYVPYGQGSLLPTTTPYSVTVRPTYNYNPLPPYNPSVNRPIGGGVAQTNNPTSYQPFSNNPTNNLVNDYNRYGRYNGTGPYYPQNPQNQQYPISPQYPQNPQNSGIKTSYNANLPSAPNAYAIDPLFNPDNVHRNARPQLFGGNEPLNPYDANAVPLAPLPG